MDNSVPTRLLTNFEVKFWQIKTEGGHVETFLESLQADFSLRDHPKAEHYRFFNACVSVSEFGGYVYCYCY